MADKSDNTKLLALAKERFIIASEAEAQIRELALDDLKFRAGDQWPDNIKKMRYDDQRPCLTINQIPQFVRQITNDQRQNRPSIQINPVDSEADVETAKVLEGMVRHIEYDSGADAAYDTAFQAAVTSGFGYFRINTAYTDENSFDQDIKILRVRNAFTVYFDPTCKEPDYSDAMWAFVVETLSKEDFKEQYPKAELSEMGDWSSTGDGWINEDECRIAEYWRREAKDKTIYQLDDGTVTEEKPSDDSKIKNKRTTQMFTVKWDKINGNEVLETTEWPGKWIPIIPVLGDELDVDGERILEGIVRQAKDPQRQYNYMSSATTETIALAPKAPFIAAVGQIENFETDWQSANIKNLSVLQYNPVSLNGADVPPPVRNTFEPAIQATTIAMGQSSQDLKAVTGIYQAALGAQGNETSGKGILARQQQSHGANFHFVDNLSRSLRHAGRIIVDLIPHIYDTQRTMRIIGEDGQQSTVQLQPGSGQQPQQTGQPPNPQQQQQMATQQAVKKTLFDVTVGKYDVTVSTGPSYQTKRQEAVASQMQLVSSFPQIMPVAGDIMVRNMDWPGAEEIADRMEKMLPPQLQEGDGIPPAVQQHVAQLTQQNQQLTQALQKTTEELKDKTNIKAMELESKERVEFAKLNHSQAFDIPLDYEKLRVQLAVAELAAKSQANIKQAETEKDIVMQQGEHAHEYAMQQVQAEQQQEMMQQQQEAQTNGQDANSTTTQPQQNVQPAQNPTGQS